MRPYRLALLLAAGFWGSAAALAAGLAWAAYERFASGHPFLGVFALLLALTVVGAVVLEPGGPRRPASAPLDPAAAPELHALVAEAAARGGGPAPAEVRVGLANLGWCDVRGGRAVVCLGLPQVAALDRDALRSVAAQALATRPRSGLERRMLRLRGTLRTQTTGGSRSRVPLVWFAGRFAAATDAAVRELAEHGRLRAIEQVGPEAAARASAAGLEPAWLLFWRERVRADLDAGVRPAMAAGFHAALAGDELRAGVSAAAHRARTGHADDWWAGHLDLARRLGHPGAISAIWPLGGDPGLVAEAATAEPALLAAIAGEERVAALRDRVADERRAGDRSADAPETAAPSPAPAPLHARIAASPRTRVLAAAALGILLAALVPLTAFLLLAAPLGWTTGAAHGLVVGGAGLAGVATIAWTVRRYAPAFRPAGSLVVDERRVLLEYPALQPEPLSIPLAKVAAVAVDRSERDDVRFPVRAASPWDVADGGAEEPLGYLWSRAEGAPVPVLVPTPDAPNVAVVLREPVGPGRAPAVLLRVEDPEAALRAFARLGVLSDLRAEHLALAGG